MLEEDTVFPSVLDLDPHERINQLQDETAHLSPEELLHKGFAAFQANDSLLALVCLERAAAVIDTPELSSTLAFCLAKELARFDRAVPLCRAAMAKEPDNTLHYLLMGRILLMQGKKPEAIDVLNEGLGHGADARIIADLQLLGYRRKPVIPFLHRQHLLNQSLGYILDRARRRKH